MSWLGRLLGRSEDERCDFGEHDYGPWTDFRWMTSQVSSDDGLELRLEYEMERECRECGKTDRYWGPRVATVEFDVDWWHQGIRGSEVQCGMPIFEDVNVEHIHE